MSDRFTGQPEHHNDPLPMAAAERNSHPPHENSRRLDLTALLIQTEFRAIRSAIQEDSRT